MKRLIAILLFSACMLPFASPAFALGQDAAAGVPACCRRNGAHHCTMNMVERTAFAAQDSETSHWRSPFERCPYCPASVASPHQQSFAATVGLQPSAEVFFSSASGVAQTESKRRISRDRSRQKRGPPIVLLA